MWQRNFETESRQAREAVECDVITNILATLGRWQHAFTIEELFDFIYPDIHPETLRTALAHDSRFTDLENGTSGERYFIAKKALSRWFAGLSIRLARAHQVRLSGRQLAMLMSSLCPHSQWTVAPTQAIRFGQRFGFIGCTCTSDQYIFPIAHILSFVPPASLGSVGTMLENVVETEKLGQTYEELVTTLVQKAFSQFGLKVGRVVRAREGLLTGATMTLQEIGDHLGVTRERVRQIEATFWERIEDRDQPCNRHLVTALLWDVVLHQGSLIISNSSSEALLRKFIAKCAGIPSTEFAHTGIVILGASREDVAIAEPTGLLADDVDGDAIATLLESKGQLCLIDSDIRAIAENVTQFRQERATKGQKVYLALKTIGKPAHYSHVTEAFNSLFPDDPASERNVHAALGREKYGIVWIGVRGVYALKEWGYEHPPKGLFEAVTEIVEQKFAQTGRPVPFEVISAEIGKYRQVVPSSSLTIAAHCNPCLQRVYGNRFIPKASADQAEEEISADELDRILKEFEKPGRMAQDTGRSPQSTVQQLETQESKPRSVIPEERGCQMAGEREPAQMDDAAEAAALELLQLPEEAVMSVGEWWNKWYMQAGHKRLGRVLLRHHRGERGKQDRTMQT